MAKRLPKRNGKGQFVKRSATAKVTRRKGGARRKKG